MKKCLNQQAWLSLPQRVSAMIINEVVFFFMSQINLFQEISKEKGSLKIWNGMSKYWDDKNWTYTVWGGVKELLILLGV